MSRDRVGVCRAWRCAGRVRLPPCLVPCCSLPSTVAASREPLPSPLIFAVSTASPATSLPRHIWVSCHCPQAACCLVLGEIFQVSTSLSRCNLHISPPNPTVPAPSNMYRLYAFPTPSPNIIVSMVSPQIEADLDNFSRRLKISPNSPHAVHAWPTANSSPGKLYNLNTDPVQRPVVMMEPDTMSDTTSSSSPCAMPLCIYQESQNVGDQRCLQIVDSVPMSNSWWTMAQGSRRHRCAMRRCCSVFLVFTYQPFKYILI